MTRECSGCGDKWCDGRCYLESPDPTDEPTISTLTMDDLRKLYGNPFDAPPLDQLTECLPDPLRKVA